ncbi:hypothetical protein BKA66DRAFT_423653 [Pyrenochaeta sp. MPI-SDFR-AT-0127]|nr:hypothetical protein BKA66DRAFT_423653 [Pyrenochaeta sp. MPI-SDFR-AT-0127]
MSLRISFWRPAIKCKYRLGLSAPRQCRIKDTGCSIFPHYVRLASGSTKPPGSTKSSSLPRGIESLPKERVDASRKASLLLNRLSKASKKATANNPKKVVSERLIPAPVTEEPIESAPIEAGRVDQKTIEIDEKEEVIQQRIIKNRRTLLWPGMWTIFAVTGTYGTFAFLDAKYSLATTSGGTSLPKREPSSQSWFLTPTVVKDGLKSGWKDLDKLTIGIVVASVAIHFMKRSPLPIWEHLIHITGEKKYTAFTYPFVHSNWTHIGQNMFALCWFLPGVVQYFDGDLFHTASFFVSVPLITSYLQHFAFRWGSVKGLPLNMGSSGAIAAVFGAFCMAYPDERVWTPSFLILRLDAKYWGALFALWQLAAMVKTPKGGNRPAFIVHLVSLGLGAAYVYFDAKDYIWEPLVTQIAEIGPGTLSS